MGLAYQADYYSHGEVPSAPGDWRQTALRRRYQRREGGLYRFLAGLFQGYPHTDQPGSVLDIGCGTGQRMARLRDAGWAVFGIEPSQAAADVARRAGLGVQVGVAEKLPFGDGCFDAVVMAHSLEHCYQPRDALREAYRVLKSGGQLVVTTPNTASLARWLFGSAWLHWDIPRHIVVFHRRELLEVLAAVGFKKFHTRGSSSGGGIVDSAVNLVRTRMSWVPKPGAGLRRCRQVAGAFCLLTNGLPWADEMEIVAFK